MYDFIQKYYKIVCENCNTIPKEATLCLICEKILCKGHSCKLCIKTPDQIDNHDCKTDEECEICLELKGELTRHSYTCGGGSSVFISIEEGLPYYIFKDRAVYLISPYKDKYGQPFRLKKDVSYIDFKINDNKVMEKFRTDYMNH